MWEDKEDTAAAEQVPPGGQRDRRGKSQRLERENHAEWALPREPGVSEG